MNIFILEDHVKQALINLNNDPSSNHLNIYNSYLISSESIMKNIRLKRSDLTNLIIELHRNGIYLDDEDEDDNNTNSSLDEGIDEHSLSGLDLSSKLSSLNNSDNNTEELF
jgi:hypothetical protein